MNVNQIRNPKDEYEYYKRVSEIEKIYKDKKMDQEKEEDKKEDEPTGEFESMLQESINNLKSK